MGWFRIDLAGARVAFTDRHAGVSRPPFDSLNLALTDDDPPLVAANRAVAGRLLGDGLGAPERWVPVRQVHGTDVAVVPDFQPVERQPGERQPVDADAVVLTEPGPVAAVLTADCAPLALVAGRGAAAVHAGWRGLAGGVVEAAVATLAEEAGSVRHAVLGPCIRSCCYEFGEEELAGVAARYGESVRARTRSGRPALDLPAGVRAALVAQGVGGELLDLGVCTACSPDWFSYRRDGTTGRQGLLVAVMPDPAPPTAGRPDHLPRPA